MTEVQPQAPVAVNDSLAASNEDTPRTIPAADLLGNDTDADGSALSIATVTSGTGGTVVLNAGNVDFIPTPNFTGTASFAYTASDGTAGSNAATVTFTVTAVNDSPLALDDALAASNEDTPRTILAANLLGNDTDVDGNALSIATVTSGTGGTVVLNAGNVDFTPTPNFTGTATFAYTASDGTAESNTATVTFAVTAANDAPVAVDDTLAASNEDTPRTILAADLLGNDTDVDGNALSIATVTSGTGGTVVLNAGNVDFTPTPNFTGAANFSYTASDGTAESNTATVTFAVTAANDAPVAVNNALAASNINTARTIAAAALLGNDTDVDGDALSIATVTSGTGGTVVLNADNVDFTPMPNFTGTASFTYTASDGTAGSNAATVTFAVLPHAIFKDGFENPTPPAAAWAKVIPLAATGSDRATLDLIRYGEALTAEAWAAVILINGANEMVAAFELRQAAGMEVRLAVLDAEGWHYGAWTPAATDALLTLHWSSHDGVHVNRLGVDGASRGLTLDAPR